ncbi:hypothetical protein [Streptomyces canus]|uniref:hypothetical protein n=1 Tax=Streptomyces canus TaxID=58343 RepID=UPI001319CF58|nr:hypothetical protein [Streptomyces canus]
MDDTVEAVLALEMEDDRVTRIRAVRNPENAALDGRLTQTKGPPEAVCFRRALRLPLPTGHFP